MIKSVEKAFPYSKHHQLLDVCASLRATNDPQKVTNWLLQGHVFALVGDFRHNNINKSKRGKTPAILLSPKHKRKNHSARTMFLQVARVT